MGKILKDNRGETMVELMVAFVLFMLALATLTVLVSVGLKLNRQAADADRLYYSDFQKDTATKVTVTMTVSTSDGTKACHPEVDCYTNKDGLFYFE